MTTAKRLSDAELAEIAERHKLENVKGSNLWSNWYECNAQREKLLSHIAALTAPPSQGKVERARTAAAAFYEHIKHGDEKHRAWLKEECDGKLSELISQALTEPAQGTSWDCLNPEDFERVNQKPTRIGYEPIPPAEERLMRVLALSPSPPQQDGSAAKALSIVTALANTPWEEWRTRRAIYDELAEFRALSSTPKARTEEDQ